MGIILLILLLVAETLSVSNEQILKDLFDQWKINHNKTYTSVTQDELRFSVFAQNYLDILEFNAKEPSPTLVLNQFADLSSREFTSKYTSAFSLKNNGEFHEFNSNQVPPVSIDWREKAVVTSVKNQGLCPSGWAFSAVGALEGLYSINNKQLVSFSEQNMIDCVQPGNGCHGGSPTEGFAYTAQTRGIESEENYPYKDSSENCAFNSKRAYNVNSGYYNVKPGNLQQMKLALAQQPVSALIQANQLVFQFYGKGVLKSLCDNKLNHAVLVVGYDNIDGEEVFIVKNSWGVRWGDKGYIYISTDSFANKGRGYCGILSMPTIPVKEKRIIEDEL